MIEDKPFLPKWFVWVALASIILWWLAVAINAAVAHDQWQNGMTIPAWVKSACCGPADAHILEEDDIEELSGGRYRIKGIDYIVPPEKVFDSMDGHIWAFYPTAYGGKIYPAAMVYCLFVSRGS